jgi:hypothetical protein
MISIEELNAAEKILQYIDKYPEEFKECQREIEFIKDFVRGVYSTGGVK